MTVAWAHAGALAAVVVGCGGGGNGGDGSPLDSVGSGAVSTGGASTGESDSFGQGRGGDTSSGTSNDTSGRTTGDMSGEPPGGGQTGLDTGGSDSGDPGMGMGPMSCEKVDFLFVIDNSGSMADEQKNLIDSFPGFIQTVRERTGVNDFQIMVIDTDAYVLPGTGTWAAGLDCSQFCRNYPGGVCDPNETPPFRGQLCNPPPQVGSCNEFLGAAKTKSATGQSCGVTGGQRFMTSTTQPDLEGVLACVAQVGTEGDPNERTMEAMAIAVTNMAQPGQCNAGFVRDDALLVVTVVTDEEDDAEKGDCGEPVPAAYNGSQGDPQIWFELLTRAKGEREQNLAVLSLIGPPPPATPDDPAQCPEFAKCSNSVTGAEVATRIAEFTKKFTYGSVGRICEPTYDAFFDKAVAVISDACQGYVPPR